MATISIIGRGGKTTIKTMLNGVLSNVRVWEGAGSRDCDVIIFAGLARPAKKELQYFSKASAIIANADANYSIRMPCTDEIVDYGFSNKATVTASSINQEEQSQTFTCCVQRTIKTLGGNCVLPKEFSVRLDVPGKYNIYNALASISAFMIFDVDDDTMTKTLAGLKFDGNMERIFDGDFSIVYNKISNPYQLFSVLESQSENESKNIYLVLDSFEDYGLGMKKKIADVIRGWFSAYNYNIYIENEGNNPSYIMQQLKEYNVDFKADKMYNVIKDVMNSAGKGDEIFLLGSDKIRGVWTDYLNIS